MVSFWYLIHRMRYMYRYKRTLYKNSTKDLSDVQSFIQIQIRIEYIHKTETKSQTEVFFQSVMQVYTVLRKMKSKFSQNKLSLRPFDYRSGCSTTELMDTKIL